MLLQCWVWVLEAPCFSRTFFSKLWRSKGRKGKKMESYDSIKKQRYHIADKGLYSQNYGFSSSHVWMWELNHKKGWALKNWYFWTVVLEKTLESSVDCKDTKPANPKGNQPWIVIEGLMLKLKLQYFGHLIQRENTLEKTLILGKIEGKRRREWWMEDKMVG